MMENTASCLTPVSAEFGTFKKLDSSRKAPNKTQKIRNGNSYGIKMKKKPNNIAKHMDS